MAVGVGQRCVVRIKVTDIELRNARDIMATIVSPQGAEKCQEVSFDEVSGLVYVSVDVNSAGNWYMWLCVRFANEVFYTSSFVFAEVEGDAKPCDAPYIVDVEVQGESVTVTPPKIDVDAVTREEFERLSKDVAGKVDKVDGKGLSTNNYTDADKALVAKIPDIAKRTENNAERVEQLSNDLSNIKVEMLIPTTYSDLHILKNEGKLIAGAFYRITDYECVTNQPNSRSANHQFDIIVQAIDERTLSENAHAIHHDGDTYFANSKLNAWKIQYAFDADIARFNWADSWDSARPQSWETKWGVLESKDNTDASNNYTTAIVDGKTKYLYRPNTPTSYLDGKEFYREVEVGSITSPNGFIYEADNEPYGEGEDFYWDEVYEIRVKTADGRLVATLDYSYDGDIYYDREDYDYMYPLSFNPNPVYDEEEEVYIYSPNSGVESWFEDFKGGSIIEYGKEIYNGSTDSLYYAFSSALPQTASQPIPEIYSTETGLIYQSDNWNDSVTYKSRIIGAKGVIYRMVDEWGNDCPYDFKNMQFLKNGAWYYTFAFETKDASVVNRAIGNYIKSICNYIVSSTSLPSYILPQIVFNLVYNKSANPSIAYNNIDVRMKSGFFSAMMIELNSWQSTQNEREASANIQCSTFYNNTIVGCMNLEINNSSISMYGNIINFRSTVSSQKTLKIDCSKFINGTIDTSTRTTTVNISGGAFDSCNVKFERPYGSSSVSPTLSASSTLQNCTIRTTNGVTIKYSNTTSTNAPLSNLDGIGDGTITIPSTFPIKANYKLNFANNSNGVLKMWCDADLVQ